MVVIAFRYFVVYFAGYDVRCTRTVDEPVCRFYVSPRKLTAPTAYALERLFVIKFLVRTMNWNAFD